MKAMMKNDTPRNTATPVMMWMKCAISRAIGVSPISRPEARLAIRPMTVLSPVWTTTPRHVPENTNLYCTEWESLVQSKMELLIAYLRSGYLGDELSEADLPTTLTR